MTSRTKTFLKWCATAVSILAVTVNLVSCFHARSMIRWDAGDRRTQGPEELGWTDRARVLVTGVKMQRPVDRRTPSEVGLGFTSHRFANGLGDELAAWHVPADSSCAVFILLHGYAAAKGAVLPVAEALHELGQATLLVDFHGSGESTGRHTTLGAREAHDVVAAIGYCRRTWPDRAVIVYGQSMGAAAALRAVARHGAVPDGLIIESVFDRLINAVRWRFDAMGLPRWPGAELLVFWGGIAAGFDGFDHNPVDDAAAVGCPALVLHGTRDPRVSSAEAVSVSEGLAGWHRYLEIEAATHCSVFSDGRDRWALEIGALLEQVCAGGS